MANSSLLNLHSVVSGGNEHYDIRDLASRDLEPHDVVALGKILDCLKEGDVEYQLDLQDKVINARSSLSAGELSISSDNEGRLTGIKISSNQSCVSLSDLVRRFEDVGLNYQVVQRRQRGSDFFANVDKVAVASLSKLYICELVYRALESGFLEWDTSVRLKVKDLRSRSAGLRLGDVGSEITVRDLITYALLASDNTAADLLLELLRSTVPQSSELSDELNQVRSIKEVYGEAFDTDADLGLLWPSGRDYFFSINRVADSMMFLNSSSWTPWDDLGERAGGFAYKGGQAPGVLSGMWCERRSKRAERDEKVLVGFAINSPRPLAYIDEIWIIESIISGLREM